MTSDWEKRLAERKAQGAPKPEPRRDGFWTCARDEEARSAIFPMTDEEIVAIVSYMEASTAHAQCLGFANCRICNVRLGTADMITPDGKWIFPERREHYVLAHGVRPDDDFVADALAWRRKRKDG